MGVGYSSLKLPIDTVHTLVFLSNRESCCRPSTAVYFDMGIRPVINKKNQDAIRVFRDVDDHFRRRMTFNIACKHAYIAEALQT